MNSNVFVFLIIAGALAALMYFSRSLVSLFQ